MRTTLNLDDEALSEVRKYASQRTVSLGEAATSLICLGAASLPKFPTGNGWVLFDSVPGTPPLTNETVKALADEDLNEEVLRPFSPRRSCPRRARLSRYHQERVSAMAPSPVPKPQKTIDEMSPEEFEEWRAWLFAKGVTPAAIRGDIPASVSSYAWDAALGATVEHVNGETYIVELIEGKLTRVEGRRSPLAMSASATPSVPEVRIREVA